MSFRHNDKKRLPDNAFQRIRGPFETKSEAENMCFRIYKLLLKALGTKEEVYKRCWVTFHGVY